jgi:hypothetical protein
MSGQSSSLPITPAGASRASAAAHLGAGRFLGWRWRLEHRSTKNDEGRTFPFDALPELAALLRAQREHTSEVERQIGVIVANVFTMTASRSATSGGLGGLRAAGRQR